MKYEELKNKFNRIVLGGTKRQRDNLEKWLRNAESTPAGIAVSLTPILGDSVNLITQIYYQANSRSGDPISSSLSALGLVLDASAPADAGVSEVGAEAARVVNTSYKIGGPITKSAVKELVSGIGKGISPREAGQILYDAAGYMTEILTDKLGPKALNDAIALAKDGAGGALSGLRNLNKSFKELKEAGLLSSKSLTIGNKLAIAKYHIFAPELAKSMAKCGPRCIDLVESFSKNLEAKGINKVDGIRNLESDISSIKNRNIQNGYKQTEKDQVEEALWKRACKVPNSFDAATLIRTSTGLRPINSLLIGDQVLAYNEATAANGYYPITATMQHLDTQATTLRLQGADGSVETINTTPEHPFYVTQEVDGSKRPSPVGHEELNSHWIGAGHLVVGDKLKLADGTLGTVRNVTTQAKTQQMFNLTVAQAHTFYVGSNGWLVHNAKRDWCFVFTTLDNGKYKSPAGLIYGDDPNWPNRLEHIMKHMGDDPTRRLHGVFTGDALKDTDEAYKLIQANPSAYLSRTVILNGVTREQYLVPMGRVVGYQGGSTGALNGNPALSSLEIWIENGNHLITSFPK